MENATKALIMAGSVLLAMMIIGAGVFMFRSLTATQTEQEETVRIQQIAEFNKGFTAFERKLYGSELLSLVNRVTDYNKKVNEKISGYDGYKTITLSVDGKSVDYYANMVEQIQKIQTKASDAQLQEYASLVALGKDLPSGIKVSKDEIDKFSNYIEFKRKSFKHVSTDYYKDTGRIKSMSYQEVK